MMKVFIIGGGASGLVAAITAKRSGADVTILERNDKLGRKLLLTGNGRCNYYNSYQDLSCYHSSSSELIPNFINRNNLDMVLSFFDKLGLYPTIKDGYYYPVTNQANSVLAVLLNEIEHLNINVVYNCYVTNIKKNKDTFVIYTEDNKYIADKVIIATGSKSYSKTGSDGFGYSVAKDFKHTIIPVLPSLTFLKGNENYYKDWNGIRSNASVSLFENDQKIKEEVGEIQLTSEGISGICVYNLSGIIAKALNNNSNVHVRINFVPFYEACSIKDFVDLLDNRNKQLKGRNVSQLFDGLLNYKLINLLLKLCKIDNKIHWEDLSNEQKCNLADRIINFKFIPTGVGDYDKAQVCSGGVALSEINLNTMESLLMPGLFFTGEVIDLDGDCGGYNLTIAWISGLMAGGHVND
ncbi:MAG: NAD(P)/FAD-dependent oxidoreductase [Bacilli bacterium]|nr:NAD(P)/FAD-dependent oxidoreductase [Bacilli bacterium]